MTPTTEGGMFPANMDSEIKQFEKLIKWKKVDGTDTELPEPQQGLDENFDKANGEVSRIKGKLHDHL